jgi:hypothetical protein
MQGQQDALREALKTSGLGATLESAMVLLNPGIVPNCVAACSCCCEPGGVHAVNK